MDLPEKLGYQPAPARPLQKSLQRVAATRPAAWLLARTLRYPDRLLFRLTGGRTTVSSLLAGLPVLMLTTQGARTGRTRATPLTAIPLNGRLAIIGSNFGQASTPGWVYNLEHNPGAELTYGAATVPVTCRRADPGEADHIFEVAAGLYAGYAVYRGRAHRTIRVFVLSSR